MVVKNKNKSKTRGNRPRGNPSTRAHDAPVATHTSVPRVYFQQASPAKGGVVRYRGVDYVGAFTSSTSAINALIYDVTMVNTVLFPRLSAIASVFAKYHLHRMRFIFRGKSASTQPGNLGFGGIVNDGLGGTFTVATEAGIKNLQGCLTVKGWEDGVYDMPVRESGLTWHTIDADGNTDLNGSSYGPVYRSIPATTAAGDLSWDLYVEYDAEFAGAVANGAVD